MRLSQLPRLQMFTSVSIQEDICEQRDEESSIFYMQVWVCVQKLCNYLHSITYTPSFITTTSTAPNYNFIYWLYRSTSVFLHNNRCFRFFVYMHDSPWSDHVHCTCTFGRNKDLQLECNTFSSTQYLHFITCWCSKNKILKMKIVLWV